MGKTDSDKKLNRFSTIIEIITNLSTIASWVLGVGSAYILNIQTVPVIVPGIDITLDLGFQFALLISAMLGYIHFLQNYWENNKDKLKFSKTFTDFSFWDLPRFRQPLLLIPVVIAFSVFVQVSIKSSWLIVIFLSILAVLSFFIYKRFSYNLSPEREDDDLLEIWHNDSEWFERWSKRIKKHLELYIAARVRDFYRSGMTHSDKDKLETIFALHVYFEKFEFEEDLVLTRLNLLPRYHPCYEEYRDEWVLLQRKNFNIQKSI